MKNPVDLLCYLLSKKQFFYPQKFNQNNLDILKQLNYWDYTGIKNFIECDDCEGDIHHLMELPMGGVGYYCPEIPEIIEVDTSKPEYHYASLRVDNIITDIQKALEVTKYTSLLSKKNKIQETDHIKNIGSFDFYKQKAYAILVTRYNSIKDKEDIEYFIQSQIKDNRLKEKIGFIFCTDQTKITAFEHGFYSIPLSEIAIIQKDYFTIDMLALNALLPTQIKCDTSTKQYSGGRPKQSHTVITSIINLINAGYTIKEIKKNKCFILIQEHRKYNKEFSLRTYQNAIRDYENGKN